MNLLQKIFSFIYPLKIKSTPSSRSGTLEVTLVNGKLVIDSENANYSYGSLQKVLKKGLLHIGRERLNKLDSILVLGVAGGSVIKTLRDDFKLDAKITGVEIDADVIELANTYFELSKTTGLELITADAFEYVATNNSTYDLIIIDIFNDMQMPSELFESEFWTNTTNIMNKKGLCIFNSIYTSRKNLNRNDELKAKLTTQFSSLTSIKTNKINELFILRK